MRRLLVACVLVLASSTSASAQAGRAGDVEPAADYEAALTDILQAVVTESGLVRYDLLRGSLNPAFRRVLKSIETYDATRLGGHASRLAFWMNAYNVQMLQNIVDAPHVRNIVDDGYADAFFKTPVRTAGLGVTLDEIENVILRRQPGRAALQSYQPERLDPRIHVGLNCAAVSCPRLRKRAFTAQNVDAELDAALRDFARSPRHFRVEGDRVVLSALLDWYGADFDRPGQPAGDFLLRYMPETRPGYRKLKEALQGHTSTGLKGRPGIRFEYSWTLNNAP